MSPPAAPQQRLDHLHGLRGIAALLVILQHVAQVVSEAGFALFDPMLASINFGRFGVLLFFLISGFVIPFSFRGDRPLRHFAISRVFRLYPAYWLSIPILSVVAWKYGRAPDLPTLIANLSMVQEWLGYPNIGWGYWTLIFEMGFYLLTALLFAARALSSVRINALLLTAMLVLTLLPFADRLAGGTGVPVLERWYFVALFLTGMLLRRVAVDRSAEARGWAIALLPPLLLAGLLLGGAWVEVPANRSIYFRPLALMTSMTLPPLLFILILALKPRPGRALMWFGTISYSLYLFQDIGLHLLPWLLPPGRFPLIFVAAVFLLTIAMADAVYRFVEAPMIRVGRRLADRPRATAAIGVAP